MLIAMHLRGVKPDLILFADTGAEHPETYAFIPVMNAWLEKVGFPQITIVRYQPKRAPYETLEGKCLANETLPSLAFGGHSCALVFKVEPQNRYVAGWLPAIEAWADGIRVRKAIGYDDGAQDRRRRAKADRAVAKNVDEGNADASRYEFWYPLQDWEIDRVACLQLIADAGLPCPKKSACFFCPASKKSEVLALRDQHPMLFKRAIAIETRARDGKHGLDTVKGLGRTFAWADLRDVPADEVVDTAETLRP